MYSIKHEYISLSMHIFIKYANIPLNMYFIKYAHTLFNMHVVINTYMYVNTYTTGQLTLENLIYLFYLVPVQC